MALSHESQIELARLRQRITSGETPSDAEMMRAVELMREGRTAAAITSAKARTAKAKAAPINTDDLLSQLEGL